MNAQLAIWGSVLASEIQANYYITLINATEQLMEGFVEENNTLLPQNIRSLLFIHKTGLNAGLFLGFFLTWPIADSLGRRNGLLWSNMFLLLTLAFQWLAFLGNLPFLLLPTRMCIGAQLGLQIGLYHLYIYETSPKSWRTFAVASIFLGRILLSSATTLLLLFSGPFGNEERWPWLLTFVLIPAGIQTGALLCCVESPGWTAIQGGNPPRAQRAADRLSLSPSDMEDLLLEEREVEEDIGPVRDLAFQLVLVSLASLPQFGGMFFSTDKYFRSISNQSPTIIESGSTINFSLILMFVTLTWGSALWLGSRRLSAKRLFFGSLVALTVSTILRLLVMLLPLLFFGPLRYPNNPESSMEKSERGDSGGWGTVAWTLYIIDSISAPLPGFLFTSLLILLMELGDQRGRASLLFRTCLVVLVYVFLYLVFGLMILVFAGFAVHIIEVLSGRGIIFSDGGGGGVSDGTILAARLGVNLWLACIVRRVWGLVDAFEVRRREEGRGRGVLV